MRVVSIHRELIGYLNSLRAQRPAKIVEKGILKAIDDVLVADNSRSDRDSRILGRVDVFREHINDDYPKFKPNVSYHIVFNSPKQLDSAYFHFANLETKIHDVTHGKKGPLMKIGDIYAEFVGLPLFQGQWRVYHKDEKSEKPELCATATLNKHMKKPWTREDMGDFAETYQEIDQGYTESSTRGIPIMRMIPKIQIGKKFLEDDGTAIDLFFGEARGFAEDILLADGKGKDRVRIVRKENGFEGCITYSMPCGSSGTVYAELKVK